MEPTLAVAGPDFVIDRSADVLTVKADAPVLLAKFGSVVADAAAAVFVRKKPLAVAGAIWKVKVNWADAPLASVPPLQITFGGVLLHEKAGPLFCTADTKISWAG